MESRLETVAVIPAYNEEPHIKAVVQKANKYVNKVIVVDDGSVDCTGNAASNTGAKVVRTQNRGAGAATFTGILGAINVYQASIVVTLDGDGQHNANDIPKLLRPIRENTADIVVGSRFIRKYDGPQYRSLGIRIINMVFNLGHSRSLTDTQCCMRAYRMDRCMCLLPVEERHFGFSTELLVKARKHGLRIVEVPVECIYHEEQAKNSTWHPVRHGIHVALKTLLWRLKMWC